MTATPCCAAMETSLDRSRAVGNREIRRRNCLRRPCFSRVFPSVKSRSLEADRDRTALAGPVQEPGGGVPDLGVPMVRATGQVVGEAAGFADRVAVPVQAPGRVVVVVGVDTDTALGYSGFPRQFRHGRGLPYRGEVPAASVGVVGDGVGDGPVRGDPVCPRVAAVGERDGPGELIPAVRGVGEVGQRPRTRTGGPPASGPSTAVR